MNFTQMHEQLRVELLRRIQRGTLSVSLLARQSGFGQAHLSLFLRSRRRLSLEAMDRILAVQHMTTAELLPATKQGSFWPEPEETGSVPVVSHAAALFERVIRSSTVQSYVHFPVDALELVRPRPHSRARLAWQRFVAVRVPIEDALPMEPLVLPEALALIDRQYTSLLSYRSNRANLYAVRYLSHLALRYVDFKSSHLVLRPHNIGFPVELVDVDPGDSPNDLLVGRVALILNQT